MAKPINASPQVGVRWPKAELDQIREMAKREYGGNVSLLVKKAVEEFMRRKAA